MAKDNSNLNNWIIGLLFSLLIMTLIISWFIYTAFLENKINIVILAIIIIALYVPIIFLIIQLLSYLSHQVRTRKIKKAE